ncbi:MAG: 3-deoxy-manno-octulosonate cytidylyltransferase [Candidatus Latescibacteria bacterium]|nr:3-deoxy-manno-octulosonate cytidylyltransferase [Candidatus Latescibacterota bacterium]
MKRESVIGVIPARYGSSRLPGKPLAQVAGRPLIEWVWQNSQKSSVDDLVVATDDERIVDAVEKFGGKAMMTSSDHLTGTDRVAEAARNTDSDIVVCIQGDQPFLDPVMIDETIGPMLDDPTLMMGTLMHLIEGDDLLADTSVVKAVTALDGTALYFSRSLIPHPYGGQQMPVYEHIGLYSYRRKFLEKFTRWEPTPLELQESLEQLRALEHGVRMSCPETHCDDPELAGMSIDTLEDVAIAEAMLRERGYQWTVCI